MSSNWIKILIALLLGATLGLVYGWMIEPVEYTDITPGILREDYRTDYVLMVAEAYHGEYDSDAAARRLALLGGDSPEEILGQTLDYARANEFSQPEISLLQELLSAMQTYTPRMNGSP